MIKFEHSVFALPFALTGALLAARYPTIPGALPGWPAAAGWPSWRQILWIIVAMVGARSAAMTMNRIIDLRYDRENPRTRARALATGALSVGFAWAFALAASAVLVIAAWQLNTLAFELSPVALAVLFFYSYTKRFTLWSHAVLGYEHSLVSPNDLSRMNAAFFTVNGYISLLFLLFWGAAVAVAHK